MNRKFKMVDLKLVQFESEWYTILSELPYSSLKSCPNRGKVMFQQSKYET